MSESLLISRPGIDLAAERWPGGDPVLVLLGTAVSGAPQPELDAGGERMMKAWEAAEAAGDRDELNRLDMHGWLDGPAQPEGRVSGPARDLALSGRAHQPYLEDPVEVADLVRQSVAAA